MIAAQYVGDEQLGAHRDVVLTVMGGDLGQPVGQSGGRERGAAGIRPGFQLDEVGLPPPGAGSALTEVPPRERRGLSGTFGVTE